MAQQFRIKKGSLIVVLAVAVLGIGGKIAFDHGLLGPSSAGSAAVPVVEAVPDLPAAPAQGVAAPPVPLPTPNPAAVPGPRVRCKVMAWNSQMGLIFANGGPRTTEGSLMQKHGVSLEIIREDDVAKMQAELVLFAKALAKGDANPADGVNCFAVMGDGSAATVAGIWEEMSKLGPDYVPEVFGSAGYSRGEDKLLGPPDWIYTDPATGQKKVLASKLRGSLVSVFLRDGDWNIVMKLADDNSIKVNPDEKTWDADAINFFAADDFMKAAEAYIAGVCEDRPVVKDGKRTGDKKHVCINAVSTWTPADVNIAQKKGGLVSIVSTKEYRSQMPNAMIGVKKWNQSNRKIIEELLAAMYEGGDQVRAYPAALTFAAGASAAVYKEQDAAYWEKYYKGVVETDKQGLQVELGGSYANNLQDALHLFGLLPGSANLFAATYTVFGNVVKNAYPKLVPSFPPVGDVLNVSYTKAVADRSASAPMAKASLPTFTAGAQIKQVVSKKNWTIEFDTGKATLTPASLATMQTLADGALVADELAIEVHGHTDNTGDPGRNQALSKARAEAVKAWLMQKSTTSFPADRFTKVEGHGSDVEIASNDTETGRAKNRRVEIVLGKLGN